MDCRNQGNYDYPSLPYHVGSRSTYAGSQNNTYQPSYQGVLQHRQGHQPLNDPLHDQYRSNPFHAQPVRPTPNSTLNPAALYFITRSPQHQVPNLTPSGPTTPDAPSQASTIRPDQQQHQIQRGQVHFDPLPTVDQLDRRIRDIKSAHAPNPRTRLNAWTVLRTQVLGLVTAKGNEKASISAQLKREQQGMGQNSYNAIVVLEEQEKKRQEMFDMYGRRFLELGELIDEAHEEIYFGTAAGLWSDL